MTVRYTTMTETSSGQAQDDGGQQAGADRHNVPLTWDEIVEHCSRLHTTRTRPRGPWTEELREDSRPLDVVIDGRWPATITPTRMHEPGFYFWLNDGDSRSTRQLRRSPKDLAELRRYVDEGKVTRGGPGA